MFIAAIRTCFEALLAVTKPKRQPAHSDRLEARKMLYRYTKALAATGIPANGFLVRKNSIEIIKNGEVQFV